MITRKSIYKAQRNNHRISTCCLTTEFPRIHSPASEMVWRSKMISHGYIISGYQKRTRNLSFTFDTLLISFPLALSHLTQLPIPNFLSLNTHSPLLSPTFYHPPRQDWRSERRGISGPQVEESLWWEICQFQFPSHSSSSSPRLVPISKPPACSAGPVLSRNPALPLM